MADDRTLSKIEFYEHVPITTDFKHSPLFDSKAKQLEWFTQFRNDSLTFTGSYQRTEEQIRTKFKVEQLLNVNYVHVTNPSYSGAEKENSEWWGHVMDVHYINDGLVTVDWVVDPIQTFMFKWSLGKATIERGMINAVKKDGKGRHYLDESKVSILNNSEPIGVDGMAYAMAWDNVMSGTIKEEKNVSFLVIVNKDVEAANLVGMPSQLNYFVLPYDKTDGTLLNFTINKVKTLGGTDKTISSGNNSEHTVSQAIYLLAKDENFGKAGANILTSYIQNEIGFAFDFDKNHNLTTTLDEREWSSLFIGSAAKSGDNMELYSLEIPGANNADDSGNNDNSDDNGNDDDSGKVPTDRQEFLKLNINYDFKINQSKMIASAKRSLRVQQWLGSSDANIKRVADIVKSKGMSPELFFAYELMEGGISWGWLNHTYYTGDPYTDADSVAAWAVGQANTTGHVELAWYDAAFPYYTTPKDKQQVGQAFADALPKGAIGRMYLSGTAAATWAAFDPAALKGSVNGKQDYGDPIKGCMDLLKSWK